MLLYENSIAFSPARLEDSSEAAMSEGYKSCGELDKMDDHWNIPWLLSLLLPMIGVFVGWGLFIHGSFIPSLTILLISIVVFGTSLLLFVALGNFVETRSFIVKQVRHRQAVMERLTSEDKYRDTVESGISVGNNFPQS